MKRPVKKIIIMLLIAGICTGLHAQTAWELKKDQDGIKVYSGSIPNSNIKAIKVTCILNATLTQLTALLVDVKAHEQWVFHSKTSYIVKQLSPDHIIAYSEISMPWPLTNRDVVTEMNISQQPATKVMSISIIAVKGNVAVSKDKVRVPMSKVNWTVTPLSNNQLSVEYVAQADPGGDIPAWVVNSFSTKGPFETFLKLKELVSSSAYQNAQFAFVKN